MKLPEHKEFNFPKMGVKIGFCIKIRRVEPSFEKSIFVRIYSPSSFLRLKHYFRINTIKILINILPKFLNIFFVYNFIKKAYKVLQLSFYIIVVLL